MPRSKSGSFSGLGLLIYAVPQRVETHLRYRTDLELLPFTIHEGLPCYFANRRGFSTTFSSQQVGECDAKPFSVIDKDTPLVLILELFFHRFRFSFAMS